MPVPPKPKPPKLTPMRPKSSTAVSDKTAKTAQKKKNWTGTAGGSRAQANRPLEKVVIQRVSKKRTPRTGLR